MANPQAENGYTKIANEILEALCKINLSSYQSRLLFLVIRKTYGFNKTDDWISNSQIVEATGISKSHASRAKKELIERRIIVTPTGNKMKFNKDYNQWRELPKGATHTKLPIGDRKLPKGDTELPKGGNTKETIQKTITKDISSEEDTAIAEVQYGNKNVNSMLEALKGKVGVGDFKDSQRQQRIWGNNLYILMGKLSKDEFVRRLDLILADDFKQKNCGGLQFIYKEIKGFVEPKPQSVPIKISK